MFAAIVTYGYVAVASAVGMGSGAPSEFAAYVGCVHVHGSIRPELVVSGNSAVTEANFVVREARVTRACARLAPGHGAPGHGRPGASAVANVTGSPVDVIVG